jgi:cytochrome c-type biogenesis protein CcmH/NrfF
MTPLNAMLWGGPFLVMLGGLGLLLARRPLRAETRLSPEEEVRLATLIEDSPPLDTFTPELGSKNAAGITER